MAVQAIEPDTRALRHSFLTARRWLWWQSGILLFARSVCISLALGLVATLLAGWQAPEEARNGLWIASTLAPLMGLVAALCLRPSVPRAVRTVDLKLGLFQQLGTAEELLATRASGGLVPMQLARASEVARETRVSSAFPLLPRREIVTSLVLGSVTATLLVLVSLGVVLPNPLSIIRLPSLVGGAFPPPQQEVLGARSDREVARPKSPALDPIRRAIDDIQRKSQNGALSSAAAAAMLAQANAELNRIANESRVRQEALEQLADELRSTAAGREVAESLRQGDYDQAVQQLRDLGRQSDQLSEAAKREMAGALNSAAARSQNARDLSRGEAQAAQSLQSRDYASVVKSMDDLSRAVRDAASQAVPQNELAESWQQLEDLAEQFGAGSPQSSPNSALSPPVAQASSAGERSSELAMGEPAEGQEPGSTAGDSSGDTGGGQPNGGSGQPGNRVGAPPLGDPNQRLATGSNQLEVEGKIGGRFPGEGDPGTQPPSVRREGTAQSDSVSPSQGLTGRTTVPPENVFVPGERKSTIRDYFSTGSRGQ